MIIRSDNPGTRKLAAGIVANGGLIAFRTDTFYGLGADPFNPEAVAKITELKGREGKPILLLIADAEHVDGLLLTRPQLFERLTSEMWPGPLTIVVPAVTDLPAELTADTGTVGVRLPNDDSVRAVVRECGGRLTATSANPGGSEPAKSAADVRRYFPTGIDLIIDGGEVTAKKPSTVIDVVHDPPRIIRAGVITKEELAAVLGIEIE